MADPRESWHIITSKFPPQRGGIGFHSAHIAKGLEKKGYDVHIWTSALVASERKPSEKVTGSRTNETDSAEPYEVNRVAEVWNPATFENIVQKIHEIGGKVLIQYRAKSFGGYWNYSVSRFAKTLAAKDIDVRVLVHEPFSIPNLRLFDFKSWVAPFHQYFALRALLRHADYTYVTTSNWKKYLKPFKLKKRALTLPVPSNIESVAENQKAKNLRKAFSHGAEIIVGTYSSFKEPETISILSEVVVKILTKHPNWVWLALGRYSEEFAEKLREEHPDIANRVQIGGKLQNKALSANLQACDIIFQPYYQGVSTRRTSLMASLYHAMPTVTSRGQRTEEIWKETQCVELIDWEDVDGYAAAIERLARKESLRRDLSQAARLAYDTCFSLDHNLRLLINR